jgi:peptidoglycan/LPS O-acetylase OafA/YrhL
VDVFFVISGFLITRLLAGEIERTGRISLATFYARRVKRLMPQALTALAAVAALSALLFSPVRADGVARDVIAAGAYSINWRFSAQSADYFAAGSDDSPLVHFWSLAVEEQFYVAWPVLLLALTWPWRRRRTPVRVPLAAALATIVAGSFAYAVLLADEAPRQAYFSTPARVWELALGGLLAVGLGTRPVGRRTASAAAWSGLAAIAFATVAFDGGTAFPGVPALVPALGAAGLIVAGASAASAAPVRLLASTAMQRLGRLSYAWYVWHWPALVFAAAAFGPLSWMEGLLVVAASLAPTILTNRWIEEPARRLELHRRRPCAALAAAPAGVLAAAALGIGLLLALPSTPTLALADAEGAGQLQRTGAVQGTATALRPTPRNADKDRPRAWFDGCAVQFKQTSSPPCVYGRPHSTTTVVLFGDSHAAQYFDALEPIALRRGWRLVHLTKAGCPPASVSVISATLRGEYAECDLWRENALRRIERREHPALVVTSSNVRYTVVAGGRRLGDKESRLAMAEGLAKTLGRLRRAAPRVAFIRDAPRPPSDIPSCVAGAMRDLRRCAFRERDAFEHPDVVTAAARAVRGIRVIDPTRVFCRSGICPAVIGDVLVYRNTGHLTATWVYTMRGWLEGRLPLP